jgi:hypothetical protein
MVRKTDGGLEVRAEAKRVRVNRLSAFSQKRMAESP